MAIDDSYTKLLLHCDGADASTTFTDEAGKTVTRAGDAQIDTARKVFGTGSCLLDGTGDNLSVAASADFVFDGDFTIDCRVWLNAYPNSTVQYVGLIYTGYETDDSNRFCALFRNNGGTHEFTLASNAINGGTGITFTGVTFPTGQWFHLAIVRASGTLNVYYNGTAMTGSGSFSGTTNGSTYPFIIGRYRLTNYFINASIDEFRVSKGIARWLKNFTPPIYPYGTTGASFLGNFM